jgi:hypothetical protein
LFRKKLLGLITIHVGQRITYSITLAIFLLHFLLKDIYKAIRGKCHFCILDSGWQCILKMFVIHLNPQAHSATSSACINDNTGCDVDIFKYCAYFAERIIIP